MPDVDTASPQEHEPGAYHQSDGKHVVEQDHRQGLRVRHAEQLERWLAVFPREQLLVITLEQLRRDRSGTFQRLFEFLELPSGEPPVFERLHSVPAPPMTPTTRERLAEHYQPLNERLYGLVGRNLGWTP